MSEVSDPLAHEMRREGITMALYVAIVLLAALTATPDHGGTKRAAAIIWGTTLGLVVAHWFAFSVSERLVAGEAPEPGHERVLGVQLRAAAAVAGVASIGVLLFPSDVEQDVARVLTAGMIGVIVYVQARRAGAERGRSLRGAVVALLLGLAVSAIKHRFSH